MAKELYNRLGVDEHATLEQINSAYKKLALKWHPDRNPNNKEEAAEMMKKLNLAAEILRDEHNRKAYDEGRINDEGQQVESYARSEPTKPHSSKNNDAKQPEAEKTQPTSSQRYPSEHYKKSRQHFFNETPPADFFFFKSREEANRFVPKFTQQPSTPPRFYATLTPLSVLLEKIRSHIAHHNSNVGKTEHNNQPKKTSSDESYQHKKADKHQPEHVHIRTMNPLLMELILQQLIVDLVVLELIKHQREAQPDGNRPSFGMGR